MNEQNPNFLSNIFYYKLKVLRFLLVAALPHCVLCG